MYLKPKRLPARPVAAIFAALLMLLAAPARPATLAELNRDWNGHWGMQDAMFMFSGFNREENWATEGVPEPADLPAMKPKWLAKYRANREQAIKGNPVTDFTGDCIPYGFPLMMFFGGQFQFTDTALNFFTHDYFYRHIDLKRSKHPRDLTPGYNGDSIGHWEGDTLVVDTVGFRDDTLLELGLTHSTSLHVVERMRMVAPDRLQVQYTFMDPVAFEEPWHITKYFVRDDKTMHADLDDEPCEVNRNARDKNGNVQFLDGQGRSLTEGQPQ